MRTLVLMAVVTVLVLSMGAMALQQHMRSFRYELAYQMAREHSEAMARTKYGKVDPAFVCRSKR